MTEQTLYENRPGGTIVRLADGTGKTVGYGTPYTGELAPENLNPLIREGLHAHADATPRLSQEDEAIAMARDAHARAALAENGNVNAGQSAVPSNYGDLDEDTATVLMLNLARYPERQASLVQHEILFGGNRRKVIDAASEQAFLSAQTRIAALLATQRSAPSNPGPPVTSPGDPSVRPGEASRSVQMERAAAAAAALGAAQLKGAAPQASPVLAPESPEPSGSGEHAKIAAEAEERLAERERLLEERAAQLDALAARLEGQRETPAAGTGDHGDTAGTGRPADPLASRRTTAQDADGGDAYGFDGKGGPNTDGYFTNDDLKQYAARHEVDTSGATNRRQLLEKLAEAGHEKPETPPES